jgi:hypothetical protein
LCHQVRFPQRQQTSFDRSRLNWCESEHGNANAVAGMSCTRTGAAEGGRHQQPMSRRALGPRLVRGGTVAPPLYRLACLGQLRLRRDGARVGIDGSASGKHTHGRRSYRAASSGGCRPAHAELGAGLLAGCCLALLTYVSLAKLSAIYSPVFGALSLIRFQSLPIFFPSLIKSELPRFVQHLCPASMARTWRPSPP